MSDLIMKDAYVNLPLRLELKRLDLAVSCALTNIYQNRFEGSSQPCLATPALLFQFPGLIISPPHGVIIEPRPNYMYLMVPRDAEWFVKNFDARMKRLQELFKEALQLYKITSDAVQYLWHQREDIFTDLPCRQLPLFDGVKDESTASYLMRIILNLCYPELEELRESGHFRIGSISQSNFIPLELVANNDALFRPEPNCQTIDLMKAWQDLTENSVVDSVWFKSDHSESLHKSKIIKAAELAQAKMQVEPTFYFPDPLPENQDHKVIDLVSVWRSCRYKLSRSDQQSLLLFLQLGRKLIAPTSSSEELGIKMMRWEQGPSDWLVSY